MSKLCVYLGETLGDYGFPNGHPFGPWRMQAFSEALDQAGLGPKITLRTPTPASQSEIERFHDHAYVEQVKRQSASGTGYLDDGDTPAFPGVYEAAATVVGSCLDAVAQIMRGACGPAFVPIAGLHHARRDRAAGFCVFNDCGVVIETLLQQYGLAKIAYVDIDAHHGDGVYYGFEHEPRVIIADIHEDGHYLYPGTGRSDETGTGAAEKTKLNLPLPPNAGATAFFEAWGQVESFITAAEPEFILLQCGVDSLAGDPLTHLQFSPQCHRHAARRLNSLAQRFAPGRLLAVGGGGYEKANIQAGWTALVEGLLDPV
ncbi:histone deacetylase [Candidatus Tenderia electrophaga]|uniref:Acetoin utilization protein AcuC n=1 Tax=Candidatus Tenderia electrophaga TaxID=1748243 RepID=A0A0S2TIA5_9GAMM|nr:histone deacetylase [Candidatus Tenderia electrophaga]